jgi:tRNA-dihydrouridine synthase
MLGRAIFGNPWLFSEITPTLEEKLGVMVEHTKLFEELLGGTKSFNLMKKHYKAYVNGFDGAVELRGRLMESKDAREVEEIVADFLA